jgi:hypothetical protein
MRFGVREICDVVLKAKAQVKIGNTTFEKNQPVIYFDSLKTSSMEGAATTVYAQGGRGNTRLIAWEGERTVTFTMEDALISPEGFMILSGAGLVEANDETPVYVHCTERLKVAYVDGTAPTVVLKEVPEEKIEQEDCLYYMVIDKNTGEINSSPTKAVIKEDKTILCTGATAGDIVLVDYYTKKLSGAKQIEITADKFGGNYYLEASTLFRDTNGTDMPAEFIIPNCKIQSNFTFTMASSGDPSTFTFTMDAFPDYTRYDSTKKVLSAIQIIA